MPNALFLNFSFLNTQYINKGLFFFLLIWFFSTGAFAQQTKQVAGEIQDEQGGPVYGATILLSSTEDSVYTSSNQDGQFHFKNIEANSFDLTITHIVFKRFGKQYSFGDNSVLELSAITLEPEVSIMDEVVVSAATPVVIKEDTVQYDADAYSVREGSLLEELLERIPGLRINSEGELIAHGETVGRIEVNGREFFGGDVSTALANLPADIIENIQVVDDYGERARRTGFRRGDPQKVLNVSTKSDKGYTGRTAAAIGDHERYLGAFSTNIMNGDREIAAIGSINNTNTTALRHRRMRMRGRGGNGISRNINTAGNYQDEYGDKLTASGSYRYSDRETTNRGSNISRSVFDDFTNRNTNEFSNISSNTSHNIDYDFEYRPDDSNFLKVSPQLDFSSSSSDNNSTFLIEQNNTPQTRISEGENSTSTDAFSTDMGAELLYFHSFSKEGRGLSVELEADYSNEDQDRETETSTEITMGDSENFRQTNQLIQRDNLNREGEFEIAYTEPVSDKSQLEVSYELDLSDSDDRQTTWNINNNQQSRIDSLSTRYQYHVTTNRAGVNFRKEDESYSYSLGLNLQPETQKGREVTTDISITNHTLNVVPEARFSYGESRRKRFTVRYRGSTSQPSFSQLQPVADFSDPQYPVIGNPALKPEFTNNLNLSYRNFSFETENMFMIRMGFRQTNNKIVSNIVNEFEENQSSVIQETRFLNTDGYHSANGHYMFNKPLMERQLSIGVNGGINYNNNVTYLNGEKRSGANWTWSQGIRFRADIEDVMSSTFRGEYRLNRTDYAVSRRSNNDLQSFRLGMRGENYFFDDWVLGYDFNKTFNNRIDDALNSDPLILNFSVEREFLENNKASLKLEGFDLLNQNTGISRSVNGNTITNSRNNLLARYFLLSFSLRLEGFER